MKKFLEYVAEDILNKYGTDLSKIAVVFPNKRASIFLNELLAIKAGKPIWSPTYTTISDLFRQQTQLIAGDQIKLICDIYKSVIECTGINETLDHFYGWGQLLLADFDDIDKNMAEVHDVFRNIKDLHELDDLSYLNDNQKSILKRFFANFSDNNETELKKRFLKLWNHIEDIYQNFNTRLRNQGIAYEGMMYREVAEKDSLTLDYDIYIFIGFNLLQKAEQRIFSTIMREGKAKFYWDFDKYYMRKDTHIPNEAGEYIKQFISLFPNELDNYNDEIYNNFEQKKNITLISSSTENIQARFISDWLNDKCRYNDGKDVAIIMCNENLLPMVIRYVPDNVSEVNITTGFPLAQTAIASLIAYLLELKTSGYSPNNSTYRLRFVLQVLTHPYACYISDKCQLLATELKDTSAFNPTIERLSVDEHLSIVFSEYGDNNELMEQILDTIRVIADKMAENRENDPLFQESLFRMYTLCNRIDNLIECGDLNVDTITLQKVIIQHIRSTSIPFHGEPATGIQIMGLLETRNLDFKHVLILSCNEGNMPKGVNDSSFIPYAIRKAYGLTTIDNKVAVYAYYFYHLLQRAEDITITYNKATENGTTGEMSRFVLQMLVESGHIISKKSLVPKQTTASRRPIAIKKDKRIMEVLNGIDSLSPTAINKYMRCHLEFYYRYIAGIKETEDISEDGIDNRLFGNIFHNAAEYIYKEVFKAGQTITESNIKNLLKQKEFITRLVDDVFVNEIFKTTDHRRKKIELNGLQIITREVIIRYIHRLLETDLKLVPFKIIDAEKDVYEDCVITTSAGNRTIRIGGRIDRLDCISDLETGLQRIRVIDYKTGNAPYSGINSLDSIFNIPTDKKKHTDYYLQSMLYSIIVSKDKILNKYNMQVSPALLFIQKANSEQYDPTLSINREKIADIRVYEKEFMDNLKRILSEIFEQNQDFTPTSDISACEYCPYRMLCDI
ncbi:MAG: PD-(D/E)XK nuclease family protein [Prevotella sp.]